MDRKKKKQNGGMYMAICCCVVVVAIVGYANRLSLKEEEQTVPEKIAKETLPPTNEASQNVVIEDNTPAPKKEETEKKEVKKAPVATKAPQEIKFSAPVAGKVIEEYSGDDLVYNEALKDWRAHSGVDFDAKMGEKVTVSAPGVVERVFDSNMGRCVIVDHKNGFRTMYASLDENTEVKEGDEVKTGDSIGCVGNTALGDVTDAPHLHFEIIKGEDNVNPVEYLE